MLVHLQISRKIAHFLFFFLKNKEQIEFLRYQSYYDLNWFEKRHFNSRRAFTIAHSNTFHHQLGKNVRNNWLPILPLNVVMLILFNQFIYFHSFINLSVKCLCDTLTIHTRKNMHLFQLRQFAKNFLRIKII